jgi:3-deoxy-D-manno-octulosonate 8-phosphate phosphatase (KDO 8-P phosphatase)
MESGKGEQFLKEHTPAVLETAKKIKLIAFDVDGVLTDGKVTYTSAGEEVKSFNVRDGHAIKLLSRVGLTGAIITGRSSPMVDRRAAELGIELVYQGSKDKIASLDEIAAKTGIGEEAIAYMGDDVVDLPVMKRVGLGCCPSDAAEEVLERADLVTAAAGGQGAARELIMLILKAKGLYDEVMGKYF